MMFFNPYSPRRYLASSLAQGILAVSGRAKSVCTAAAITLLGLTFLACWQVVCANYAGLDAGSVLNAQMNTLNAQRQYGFIYQPIGVNDLSGAEAPPMYQFRFDGQLREKSALDRAYRNALAVFKQENYPEVIKQCSDILARQKTYASAYLLRGAAYFYQRNFQQAREDASQFINLAANRKNTLDKAFTLRAASQWLLGQYQEAISDATQAIAYNPKSARAYAIRSAAYLANKEQSKAWHDVSQALALDKNSLEGLFSRAMIYLSRAQFSDSMKDINVVLSQRPSCALCYTIRGFDALALGDKARAEEDARKTLSFGVEFPITYSLLGHIANQNHQTADAKQYFERAVALYRASADVARAERLEAFIEDMTPPVAE
ncbi:MAG: hypothetical protein VKK59_03195 [Vampirovibrionales bacterium]|nr:hypothetical protein [Vampirovibrionales bacterium]